MADAHHAVQCATDAKGKVEQGGVHNVGRHALAGRTFRDQLDGNAHLRRWMIETAGVRVHGTVKEAPLTRFRELEQAAFRPLPATPYTAPIWKHAKLHRDCHVVFEQAFYSAPHRLIGETLWVRGADPTVTIFLDCGVVAVHPRATKPGQRLTNPDRLPPTNLAGLQVTPVSCRAEAEQIGIATQQVVDRLLDERPVDRLRTAHAILKLTRKVVPHRLEAACARALAFDDVAYARIKRILDRGLRRGRRPLEVLDIVRSVDAHTDTRGAREPGEASELRRPDDLVRDEDVRDAALEERLRLAHLLAADADGAAGDLAACDLGALVGLRVGTHADKRPGDHGIERLEVPLEDVEIQQQRRRVDAADAGSDVGWRRMGGGGHGPGSSGSTCRRSRRA